MSLFPQINKPTCNTHDCYSVIDNVFTNVHHSKVQCGILIDDTSDQLTVLHAMRLKENKESFLYRRKDHEYVGMLNHNLSLENWHSVYKAITADEAYDNFYDIFMMYDNASCPIVKVVHKSEKLNKHWFTKSIRNAFIKRTSFIHNF